MSCKECENSPKTYEEYCIAQNNPSVYCPDAYTENAHLCNNFGNDKQVEIEKDRSL